MVSGQVESAPFVARAALTRDRTCKLRCKFGASRGGPAASPRPRRGLPARSDYTGSRSRRARQRPDRTSHLVRCVRFSRMSLLSRISHTSPRTRPRERPPRERGGPGSDTVLDRHLISSRLSWSHSRASRLSSMPLECSTPSSRPSSRAMLACAPRVLLAQARLTHRHGSRITHRHGQGFCPSSAPSRAACGSRSHLSWSASSSSPPSPQSTVERS